MIKEFIDKVRSESLLILAIVFTLLAIIYQSPVEQMNLIGGFTGTYMQTSFDIPTVFVWFFVILFLIVFVDCFFIYHKAFKSDFLFASGLDHNCSCIGETLKMVGEWCWIRTEGIKEYPIEGYHIVCNLATHTHKIDGHVVMEGHTIPTTELTFIPSQIKPDVRQRRGGLFGASVCSVGYLSNEELLQNKQFRADDYDQELLEINEKGKMFDTSSFIESIRDKNRDLNMMIEFSNGENYSLTNFLKNVGQVGKAVMQDNNKTFIDKVFGR